VRICILSTHDEPCGIATYSAQLQAELQALGVETTTHPIDRLGLSKKARVEFAQHFAGFVEGIDRFDAFILQHEFGLYAGSYGIRQSNKVFGGLLKALAQKKKPTLIVFHSAPPVTSIGGVVHQERARLGVGGRRSIRAALGRAALGSLRAVTVRPGWRSILRTINNDASMSAVVLSEEARRLMIDSGLRPEKLAVVRHGVPALKDPGPREGGKPREGPRTIRLTIFGFVVAYKGYEAALRAMLHVPGYIELVIAGGPHPANPQDRTLENILTFVATGDYPDGVLAPLSASEMETVRDRLVGRVEITGYLPPAEVRKVLDRTDIVLAPYLESGPSGSGALSWGLAARRPILATTTAGFREMNEAEPCMLLVNTNAPHELARAVTAICNDEKLRADLVAGAARFAETHAWPIKARQILDRLEQLGT